MTRIGVVAAMAPELSALAGRRVRLRAREHLPGGMIGFVGGMGAENARRAAKQLIEGGATSLVSWGCAAALSPTLRAGTLVLPQSIVAVDGGMLPVDADWHRRTCERALGFNTQIGPLAETAAVLETVAQKRAFASSSGAVVADMESAEIARVANAHHIPFLAIRTISDGANVSVPRVLARAIDENGDVNALAAVASLALRPWSWPTTLRLALGFRAALATLERASVALFVLRPESDPSVASDSISPAAS
jgi:adenosylhomocysteine nucleosidase